MLKINVLNHEGKSLHTLDLVEEVFGIKPNEQVMFDAVMAQRHGERLGNHKVKNRSEVRGGGRKPWRQKGTGRARAGSTRSPIWVGGGTVFGPTPRSYKVNTNRKVRKLALTSALSQKVLDEELMVVENLSFETPKTKDFINFMSNLELERKVLFVVDKDEEVDNAVLSMRNIQGTNVLYVESLNVYDIMNSSAVVFTEKAAVAAGEVFA